MKKMNMLSFKQEVLAQNEELLNRNTFDSENSEIMEALGIDELSDAVVCNDCIEPEDYDGI